MSELVLIIGASNNSERYSNKALNLLLSKGHKVIAVNPRDQIKNALKTVLGLSQVKDKIDTITVYLRPQLLKPDINEIVRINPKRVIFNPGTEDPEIISFVENNGIKVQLACTLVLLNTNQYDKY